MIDSMIIIVQNVFKYMYMNMYNPRIIVIVNVFVNVCVNVFVIVFVNVFINVFVNVFVSPQNIKD